MQALGKVSELEEEQMPDVESPDANIPSSASTSIPSSATSGSVPSTSSTEHVSKDVPSSIAQYENVIST